MDFNEVWKRVLEHQSDLFYTVTGLSFTYQVINGAVVTSRTARKLTRQNFEKAFSYFPLNGPGQINTLVQGPAYVYAILTDRRITDHSQALN